MSKPGAPPQESPIGREQARRASRLPTPPQSSPLGAGGVFGIGCNSLSAPLVLLLEATRACQLACRHCAVSAGAPLPDELDTLEMAHLIEECRDLGVAYIYWSGGEPLMRPDLFDLITYAAECNIVSCLITSGYGLTEPVVHNIKASRVFKVEVNLDASTPAAFDYFRGRDGAFDNTVAGIRLLSQYNIPMRANACITQLNKTDVKAIIELASSLGLNEVALLPFHATGRGYRNEKELAISYAELKQLQRGWLALQKELEPDFHLIFEGAEHSYLSALDLVPSMPCCGAGRLHCTITPVGDVRPCPYFPDEPSFIAGNIRVNSLASIWNDNPLLKQLREAQFLDCAGCSYIRCMGGCRVRAYDATGTLSARDPFCPVSLAEV